jgi:hypothetical protein
VSGTDIILQPLILHGFDWPASRPDRIILGTDHWIGRWISPRIGNEEKNLIPPGIERRFPGSRSQVTITKTEEGQARPPICPYCWFFWSSTAASRMQDLPSLDWQQASTLCNPDRWRCDIDPWYGLQRPGRKALASALCPLQCIEPRPAILVNAYWTPCRVTYH